MLKGERERGEKEREKERRERISYSNVNRRSKHSLHTCTIK